MNKEIQTNDWPLTRKKYWKISGIKRGNFGIQIRYMGRFTLVIHGGAGTILKSDMTPELEKAYGEGLTEALNAGFAVLEEEGQR